MHVSVLIQAELCPTYPAMTWQVKYVVELARALATIPQVYRVDLLTRQVVAEGVRSRSWAGSRLSLRY